MKRASASLGHPLTLLGEPTTRSPRLSGNWSASGIYRPAAHATGTGTGTSQQWAGGEDLAAIPNLVRTRAGPVRRRVRPTPFPKPDP